MLNPYNYLIIETNTITAKYDCQVSISLEEFKNDILVETSEYYICISPLCWL